jgi:hypothetical protein
VFADNLTVTMSFGPGEKIGQTISRGTGAVGDGAPSPNSAAAGRQNPATQHHALDVRLRAGALIKLTASH